MLKPKMKVWLFGDFPLTIGLFLGEASVNFPWGNVSITIGFFYEGWILGGYLVGIWMEWRVPTPPKNQWEILDLQ